MAVHWRITGQRQSSKLVAGGDFDDVMEIRFETIPEGVPGVIEVPLRVYGAEFVANEIDRRVTAIKEVQAL